MAKHIPDELFKLEINTENPIFEGFAMEDAPSVLGREDLREDMTPGFRTSDDQREWHVPKLEPKWTPLPVKGRVVAFNDFPGISMTLPAFSKRACDILQDFLEPNGELLPLRTDVGEYYFYNLRTVIDALDIKKSKCTFWCDPPTTATTIDYFAFHKAKLAGTSIFRIVELPYAALVTRAFVDRVAQHGLNGFHFAKVWPFPRGVSWRKVQLAEKAHRVQVLGDQKANTLVIALVLAGKKQSKEELKLIKRLEDQLDAQLLTRSLDTPYFGRYEEWDVVDGQYRMFLSCPDVDLLEKKLEPWLLNIEWPNGVFIAKRIGGIYDGDAEEEVFEIY